MSKKVKILIAVVLIAVCGLLVWQFVSNSRMMPTFNGSRVRNPDCYLLDFTCMNMKDEHTLTLKQGDELKVEMEITKGHADVTIGKDGADPIYRGNDAKTGNFTVMIPEDGDYTIVFDAANAVGFAHFTLANQ